MTSRLVTPLLLPLAACSPVDHYMPVGPTDPLCTDSGKTRSAADDSDFGFSASDLVDVLATTGGLDLTWDRAEGSAGTLLSSVAHLDLAASLDADRDIVFAELETPGPDWCPLRSYLRVPVDLTLDADLLTLTGPQFVAADSLDPTDWYIGSWSDGATLTVAADPALEAAAQADLDADEPGVSLDALVAAWDSTTFEVDADYRNGHSGRLVGAASWSYTSR
jgi:hypothetical protein